MGIFAHFKDFGYILLILKILWTISDVQGYIGNFGNVGVFGSLQVFKGILVIFGGQEGIQVVLKVCESYWVKWWVTN